MKRYTIFPETARFPSKIFLGLLILNEITNNIIVGYTEPFLPEMILFFGYREQEKGYFVGLIQTAFYIGRIFGCLVIGRVADKINKYYLLNICFVLSAIFIFAYGFTLNIYFVIIMRLLIGMVSGISIVDKALIHDTCDEQNQSIGMLFYGIGVGSASIIAPLIGGYLPNPVRLYPSVFKNNHFLGQFPYFLTSVCVIGLIIFNIFIAFSAHYSTKKSSSESGINTEVFSDAIKVESTLKAFMRIIRSKKTAISLGISMLYSLVTIGIDELLVVFLSTAQFHGGLGFSTKRIGQFLIYSSIPSVIIHIFVFTKLIQKLGIIQCIKICHMGLFPIMLTIPATYILSVRKYTVTEDVLLYILVIFIRIFGTFNSGTVGLLVNNSVNVEDVGTVNGIGLSSSCVFRALAPITFNSIYAVAITVNASIGKVFGGLLAFSSIAFFILAIVILCWFIPVSLNNRRN